MDLLIALVERAGEVLSREELETSVWPKSVVEETSLRVHISILRKALGHGQAGARYIANVPGRGYCFVMEVTEEKPQLGLHCQTSPGLSNQNLPTSLTRLIGRDETIVVIDEQLQRHRLVSIVGLGGMGKTSVAIAVANQCVAKFKDGVMFVDLAPLSDPLLVPSAVASVFGIHVETEYIRPALAQYIKGKRLLLVLDNCEHVIEAATSLIEFLINASPLLFILTTTREPLDAVGEWIHRLPPLATPNPDEIVSDEGINFPAVQLFVERAMANSEAFVASPSNLAVIRHLCHQLDGIPLAIELAAGRIDSLGVNELAARLDDRFRLLTRGRRTAMPRHRTLQALFDWGHELLSDTEQTVLRRLAIFRTGFILEDAAKLISDDRLSYSLAIETILGLVAKSLVATNVTSDIIFHRFLFTTRTYAMEKLKASGEYPFVARRHAELILTVAIKADEEFELLDLKTWIAKYERCFDDLRSAVAWSVSPEGDVVLGAAIISTFKTIAHGLRVNVEFITHCISALEKLKAMPDRQPKLELRLRIAISRMALQMKGAPPLPQSAARICDLLDFEEDVDEQYLALLGLSLEHFQHGDYPASLATAQRVRSVADNQNSEQADVLLSDRISALNYHYLGEYTQAKLLASKVIAFKSSPHLIQRYVGPVPRAVSMGLLFAKTSWFMGDVDLAVDQVNECLFLSEDAHPYALCQCLALCAIPIALWRGENERARELNTKLDRFAVLEQLDYWQSWSQSMDMILTSRARRETVPVFEGLGLRAREMPMEDDMLSTFEGTVLGQKTLERVEGNIVGWCAAEIYRGYGEDLLRSGESNATRRAEAYFLKSLKVARQQEALSWELRASLSLGRLWLAFGRAEDAYRLVMHVYEKFTEGWNTSDLLMAKRFLDQDPSSTIKGVRKYG